MKKILSNISTDDIDDYTLLLQNIDSYKTLLLIKRNNGSLSENVENSQLKIMNNTGHIVNEENPEELAIVINNFLKD